MTKEIKNKFVWKILKILPIGLRFKIASRFDYRIKNILDFYGESFKRNTNWKGYVNMFGAILEEPSKEKRDRLIDAWKRVKESKQ